MTPATTGPGNGSDPTLHVGPRSNRIVPEGPRPTSASAILSLVFAFLFWPLGIVFAIAAFVRIADTGERGTGLAVAGLGISLLCSLLTLQYVA